MTNHPNRRLAALYRAWVEADKAWVAEIERAHPKEWPGDVRYIKKGKGEPGSFLRIAWEAQDLARESFYAAGGREWLMGKDRAS